MTRDLTTGMAAEVAKAALAPLIFLELDFSSGFVRVCTGVGTIRWDGKDWSGAGYLLGLSPAEETSSIEATSMSFTLSGVPSALVATAYGDFSQGRAARMWLSAYDLGAGAIISDPVLIFAGRMDTISDDDDGATAQITVTAESNLADLSRPRTRFFTNQDQQRLFSGDRSLRFVTGMQDRQVYWGGSRPNNGPGAGETL
jgi:hypothetical protein